MIEFPSGWRVSIESRDYQDAFALRIYRFRDDDKVEILQNDLETVQTVSRHDSKVYDDKSEILFSPQILQAICNALDSYGFHPQDRRYQKEMDLVKSHLEDMRKLVFKKDYPDHKESQ